MAYIVEILKVATQEISVRRYDEDWLEADFNWQEGNFACDCNRYLEFERGMNRNPDFNSGPCGEEAYLIRVTDNGSIVYDEIKVKKHIGI